jgi:hypothetical protein
LGTSTKQQHETVIGNCAPTATREFLIDMGLAGDVASLKVYVITSNGNEKGSNTVTITRP